jgi:predicted GIY-YIG superfamily endonuclease
MTTANAYRLSSKTINGKSAVVITDTNGIIIKSQDAMAFIQALQATYNMIDDTIVDQTNKATTAAYLAHSDEDPIEHYSVYILKLEQNKYYVGISGDVPKRLRQHGAGKGAKWSQKYHPIGEPYIHYLGEITYKTALKYENRYTRSMIDKYGADNVRGGSDCKIDRPT